MPTFVLTINGRSRRVTADPEMPLLWVLRDLLRMTGTKYGCGVGVCGACTVHENNAAVRSCQIPLSKAAGKSYTTIEGLSPDGGHPCQLLPAWNDHGRRGAVDSNDKPDGSTDRRGDVGPGLSLRDLSAHPPGDPSGSSPR